MNEFVVSVLAPDGPGIVAAVSGAVAELGGNITHLSETVLRGYFTMILSVEVPEAVEGARLKAALLAGGIPVEAEIGVLPFAPPLQEHDSLAAGKERFVLTVQCRDRKGIIHRIARTLADASVNIDDFYAYVLNGEMIMILEIAMRPGMELAQVQSEIDRLAAETGISAHLQHQDIFRATTELQAVLRLGDRR